MLPTGTRAKNIVASYVRKRHRPKSSMKHVTCCQPPPHKSTSSGEEEEWDMAENGSYSRGFGYNKLCIQNW